MDYFKFLEKENINELNEYLLTHHVDEEIKNQSLLYWATHQNCLSFVQKLVEKGANMNQKDRHNRTPLLIACFFGFVEVAEFLLEKGADREGCLERAMNSWDNTVQTEIVDLLNK